MAILYIIVLSNNVLNIIKQILEHVVLTIIDEISVVSIITLNYIHLDLCGIFNTTKRIMDGLVELIY